MQETKNLLPLQSHLKNRGSLAQLNRASDYGSEGCGFESRRSHVQGTGRQCFFCLNGIDETFARAGSGSFSFSFDGLTFPENRAKCGEARSLHAMLRRVNLTEGNAILYVHICQKMQNKFHFARKKLLHLPNDNSKRVEMRKLLPAVVIPAIGLDAAVADD